jgi:hypothetical protein
MFLAWCAQILLIGIAQMNARVLSIVVLNYGIGETYELPVTPIFSAEGLRCSQ